MEGLGVERSIMTAALRAIAERLRADGLPDRTLEHHDSSAVDLPARVWHRTPESRVRSDRIAVVSASDDALCMKLVDLLRVKMGFLPGWLINQGRQVCVRRGDGVD